MNIKRVLFNSCCVIALLLGITLIIIGFFVIDGVIRSQAEEGIVMTNETYGLWGVVPGDTETYTIRNFSMFNFTNPHDFLYKESVKPKFVEIGNYLYQEKSEFLNHYYTDDNELLHYDYWLYFDLLNETRNVNEKSNVINVGPLGFWMQLDTTNITSFTLQGFGGLFTEMTDTIKKQALGQGVSGTFLSNYSILEPICSDIGIQADLCYNLWNDRYYGLFLESNMQFWVDAAYYNTPETREVLFEYFYPITVTQFESLLIEISELSEVVDDILTNWFCPGESLSSCNGYRLSIKQISSSGVTNNPPPGSDPSESICDGTNLTCVGSPEITTYLRNEFQKQFPDEKYQTLEFSEECFTALFTPYKGLLNIGTLNKIYTAGTNYDSSKNVTLLKNLAEIFHAETEDHAFVIWEWIKYMTNEFVLKESRGGTRKIAGLGGVFSQAWYQVTHEFADWYLEDVYSFLAFSKVGDKCEKYLDFLGVEKSNKICETLLPKSETSYESYYGLIKPCLSLEHYYEFQSKFNLENTEIQEYCDVDEEPSNIGLLTIEIMSDVSKHYNCTENFPHSKCTETDIIVMQLFHSSITLNPIKAENYPYKSSKTANQWNSIFPTFEYQYYLEVSNTDDAQEHNLSSIRDLYSFDKLLNGPEVQELFIETNDEEFERKYHWANPSYLRNYIRFVVIEVGFGGFTQQRSPKEIFFGYTDPFLEDLSKTDTMAGGDPSIDPVIAFNEPNSAKEEAPLFKQVMYSGYGNVSETRMYVSIDGKNIITYNNTYYDGQDIQWEMVSPWAEDITLRGSDGFSVPPNLEEGDLPEVYIGSIARFSTITFHENLRKFDMELRDMRVSESFMQSSKENPANSKYFQSIRGFLNESYQGFPLFVSKSHFLDAEPQWAERVTIVDENSNIMTANEWDDTRIYVEPYTGTAFSATIYLQSNFYFQPDDILFPAFEKFKTSNNSLPRMLPIVSTFRSGNISENAVDTYFGDLKFITNNKGKIAGAGWFIVGICIVIIVGLKVRERMAKKVIPSEKASLLGSEVIEEEIKQAPEEKKEKGSLLDSDVVIEEETEQGLKEKNEKGDLLDSDIIIEEEK